MTIPSPSTSTVPRHCGRRRWRWHRPLNIAASYQYGPDSAYVTQQEEVTLPRMHIKDTWGMQPTTTYEESSSTFETQFSQQEIEPDALVVHADFFRLTDDAKARLAKAKSQLKDAVSLA